MAGLVERHHYRSRDHVYLRLLLLCLGKISGSVRNEILMSRVHDAMRRAGQMPEGDLPVAEAPPVPVGPVTNGRVRNGAALAQEAEMTLNLPSLMGKFDEYPFNQ